MSIFKCKMCGGALEIHDNETVAVCEYCGTKQTLPKLDSDKRMNLYDRADYFRRNNEFDKAMNLYEQILSGDNTDAEAYWSIVLCRYGIEYVEDPKNHKRIPTVNRTQYTSIYSDADYQSALKYADDAQRAVYEEEAKVIDDIQKGILEISAKEEPFDVFICYKETDSRGRRTPDSVLAGDLYHELVKEGFKVFFSHITLEDKLGVAYEPYIFAALNSAKVMVVIGTKPEHFNAVWVKNEWSRYLTLIKNGAKKTLIPAYRDMNPYDLPEEFAHLQAQDMSKLGFMQDLIRGIKKIAQADETKAAIRETVVISNGNVNISPLLRRVFIFLEDENWQEADEYCERVLDQKPENAQAYLGKLMAELCVRKQEDLANCSRPFDNSNNYRKILRFGDDKLITELKEDIDYINERNENTRKETIYNKAVNKMNNAMTSYECSDALNMFAQIPDWKNVGKQVIICKEKIDELKEREEAAEKRAEEEREFLRSEQIRIMNRNHKIVYGTLWAFIIMMMCMLAFKMFESIIIIPNKKYNSAMELYNKGKYESAIALFEGLGEYKDSKAQIENCRYGIAVEKYGKETAEKVYSINVGDIYTFGFYEQDNDTSNGKEPIDWIVLDKKDVSLLLISKQAIDCSEYIINYKSYSNATWNASSVRKWLNDAFYYDAFSNEEQSIIQTTAIPVDKSSQYITSMANPTNDKIFILNIQEAERYFASDVERLCGATKYAINRGADIDADSGDCCWWLRSSGEKQYTVAYIQNNGSISYNGEIADNNQFCIRPALWIDFSHEYSES